MDGPLEIEGPGKCEIIIIVRENASIFNGADKDFHLASDLRSRNTRSAESHRIECSNTYCTIIQCLVGYLEPYASFVIKINSKLKAHSFIRRRVKTQMYEIISVGYARVRSVPYDFENVDVSKFETQKRVLTTKVNTDRLRPPSSGVEMWVIAVAIIAGLLFLLLLVLLLCWCGFFKRKKVDEEGYFMVNGKTDIDDKIFE